MYSVACWIRPFQQISSRMPSGAGGLSSPVLLQAKRVSPYPTYESGIREQFRRLIGKTWLPADIERFVNEKLPAVQHESDIFEVLRQDADIDSRVRAWFAGLDDSARCFVFTLTMFAGLDTDELWARHKEIVREPGQA